MGLEDRLVQEIKSLQPMVQPRSSFAFDVLLRVQRRRLAASWRALWPFFALTGVLIIFTSLKRLLRVPLFFSEDLLVAASIASTATLLLLHSRRR